MMYIPVHLLTIIYFWVHDAFHSSRNKFNQRTSKEVSIMKTHMFICSGYQPIVCVYRPCANYIHDASWCRIQLFNVAFDMAVVKCTCLQCTFCHKIHLERFVAMLDAMGQWVHIYKCIHVYIYIYAEHVHISMQSWQFAAERSGNQHVYMFRIYDPYVYLHTHMIVTQWTHTWYIYIYIHLYGCGSIALQIAHISYIHDHIPTYKHLYMHTHTQMAHHDLCLHVEGSMVLSFGLRLLMKNCLKHMQLFHLSRTLGSFGV